MEKWEDRKLGEDKKDFSFPHCVLLEGWKTHLFGCKEKWGDRKCSLNKIIHITLLHNMRNNFLTIIKKTYYQLKLEE